MSNGIFENAWLQTSITSFQSAVLKDINTGMAKNAAIEKNKVLLKKNPYTYIEPEHVNSFEAGYKGLFAKGRIFAEADFYLSRYRSFIAQANMNVPNTTDMLTVFLIIYMTEPNKAPIACGPIHKPLLTTMDSVWA